MQRGSQFDFELIRAICKFFHQNLLLVVHIGDSIYVRISTLVHRQIGTFVFRYIVTLIHLPSAFFLQLFMHHLGFCISEWFILHIGIEAEFE